MLKRGHICGGAAVRTPDDDIILASPVTEEPSSPLLNTEFRLEQDDDVVARDEDVPFPFHLFSWHTVHTVHDMGFDDVTHPPPLVQGFPFATSLP